MIFDNAEHLKILYGLNMFIRRTYKHFKKLVRHSEHGVLYKNKI
jgi:hypothetical protein